MNMRAGGSGKPGITLVWDDLGGGIQAIVLHVAADVDHGRGAHIVGDNGRETRNLLVVADGPQACCREGLKEVNGGIRSSDRGGSSSG